MPDSGMQIVSCWQPKGHVLEPVQRLRDLIRALEGKDHLIG